MHRYRIVQELTNNTIKHGEASAMKLSIHEDEDDIKFVYLDNGAGLKKQGRSKRGRTYEYARACKNYWRNNYICFQ